MIYLSTGVEIIENFLTRHKFTNLQGSRLLEITELLDHWKMAFPHFKWKLTLLEKNIKMKLTLL